MSSLTPNFKKAMPWILFIAGIVGLVSSIVLTHDQIKIWQDPSYRPACNLNPVVSCGSVIDSQQGRIFGVAAPFYGLIAFAMLMTFGVIIYSGAQLKRWLWLALEVGAIGGFMYALWLFCSVFIEYTLSVRSVSLPM
jgi:uncharacterized membrane protein